MDMTQGQTLAMPASDAPPKWVQVLPLGTFRGKDGRGPYTLRDPQAMIANTQAYHGSTDIPVDYDHQILWTRKNGATAPAAGWIKELAARPDGIWGRVEWTPKAAQHIAAKEYRYLSPVFLHDENGNVTRLESVGLVNNPNLDLAAVSSAHGRLAFMATPLGPSSSAACPLSREDRAVCKRLGISESDFSATAMREQQQRREVEEGVEQECDILAAMGVSQEDLHLYGTRR